MVRRLVGLAVLIGLLAGADLAAKAYAQSRLQQAINGRSGADATVHAKIHSFPFLGRLLVQQKVSGVTLTSAQVKSSALTFSNVSLSLDDVKVDRGKLVRNQRVLITAIGKGSASADVTAADLSAAV